MMRVERAPFRTAEGLGQGREGLGRPVPGETVGQVVDAGAEPFRVAVADHGIDPVSGDDQIGGFRVGQVCIRSAVEFQCNTKVFSALGKNLDQL